MTTQLKSRLEKEMKDAERKAFDSLGRYKFEMFGYWSSRWVMLNRVGGFGKANPFKDLVLLARKHRK